MYIYYILTSRTVTTPPVVGRLSFNCTLCPSAELLAVMFYNLYLTILENECDVLLHDASQRRTARCTGRSLCLRPRATRPPALEGRVTAALPTASPPDATPSPATRTASWAPEGRPTPWTSPSETGCLHRWGCMKSHIRWGDSAPIKSFSVFTVNWDPFLESVLRGNLLRLLRKNK